MITAILSFIAHFIIPLAIVALVLFVLYNSVTIASGDEFITLERRWFGKQMTGGRTVAYSDEVGVQARTLGPGTHWLIPFIYKVSKHKFLTIPVKQIGLVRSITGVSLPSGEIFASPVECNLFQDGEAFLRANGQKGQQLDILPPGQYQINPNLFQWEIKPSTIIKDDEVGIVEAIAGQACPVNRNFADPVECDSFQDAKAFLKQNGQKGPQVAFLAPGEYRINTWLFQVDPRPQTVIEGGKMGLIVAMDGEKIPEGHLLGRKVDGHDSFTKGDEFIKKGGQKGRQLEQLMPGTYRINSALFQVVEMVPWTSIPADQIGIVTVLEGAPLSGKDAIAAEVIETEKHNNFQDAAAFIKSMGQKGLQIPTLRAGNYAINPWFASIEKVDMVKVDIGFCAVVTSYVGEEGTDTTDDNVNAKIVENGKKGIWAEPLGPGKHPLNTKICKVDIVPTTQILLNWADSRSSAHELDSNLKTITLRTADAFNVNMDVSVIIHIPMKNAPKVIANLGSVKNMISQVLEPAISSHFRNAAQYIKALDLYTERKELQEKAKEHIDQVLKVHHIDSKDTLIADVVLPIELTKTVTDRQIAEQEKKTYQTQKEAQIERRGLENETAQADMQTKVVESERNVEIAKNIAEGKVQEAEGSKKAAVLSATGKAEAVKLEAAANAEATKVNAGANAEATKLNAAANKEKGLAEAAVILAVGESNAKAYEAQVKAFGGDGFVRLQMMDRIKDLKLKFVPDVYIGGAGQGAGNGMEQFFGLGMFEKVMGTAFHDFIAAKKLEAGAATTEAPKA